MEISMSKNLTFKLIISEDGSEKFSTNLSYDAVSSIVSNYPDNKESNDFLFFAAQHPASGVRENVAYKDNLNSDVLEILSADNSITVLRNLVRSNAFKEHVTQSELERLITLDTEIAQTIAYNVEAFEQADTNKLATLLTEHSDPSVAANLAQNYSTPKRILKILANHPDPYVASQAKERLA
jgi:hypothetical protein